MCVKESIKSIGSTHDRVQEQPTDYWRVASRRDVGASVLSAGYTYPVIVSSVGV